MTENNVSTEIMDEVNPECGIGVKDVAKTAGIMAAGAVLFEGCKFLYKKASGAIKNGNVKETIKNKLPKFGKKDSEVVEDIAE